MTSTVRLWAGSQYTTQMQQIEPVATAKVPQRLPFHCRSWIIANAAKLIMSSDDGCWAHVKLLRRVLYHLIVIGIRELFHIGSDMLGQ